MLVGLDPKARRGERMSPVHRHRRPLLPPAPEAARLPMPTLDVCRTCCGRAGESRTPPTRVRLPRVAWRLPPRASLPPAPWRRRRCCPHRGRCCQRRAILTPRLGALLPPMAQHPSRASRRRYPRGRGAVLQRPDLPSRGHQRLSHITVTNCYVQKTSHYVQKTSHGSSGLPAPRMEFNQKEIVIN